MLLSQTAELKSLFVKAKARTEVKDMSKASTPMLKLALQQRGIVSVAEPAIVAGTLPPYTKFPWDNFRGEADATASLLRYFEGAIRDFPLSGSPESEPATVESAGRLVDARQAPLEVEVTDSANGVVYNVRGHPDAIFAINGATFDIESDDKWESVFHHACMLIDWKTEAAIQTRSASVSAQLRFEALGYWAQVKRNILVVATDCSSTVRVWELMGQTIVEHHKPGNPGGGMPLNLGLAVIAQLLPKYIHEARRYMQMKMSTSLSELINEDDGEDDDDGGGAGPDEGEGEDGGVDALTHSMARSGIAPPHPAATDGGSTHPRGGASRLQRRPLAPVSDGNTAWHSSLRAGLVRERARRVGALCSPGFVQELLALGRAGVVTAEAEAGR